jgi:hypothetical protein
VTTRGPHGMIPTFCIVPVKNQWHLTRGLLDCLHGDAILTDMLVLNDGSTDGTTNHIRRTQREQVYWKARLHQTDRTGHTIYEAWNRGFERARAMAGRVRGGQGTQRPFDILVTNNDIVLPRHALLNLKVALRAAPDRWIAYPDCDAPWSDAPILHGTERETHGVYGDGGMFGACFMVKGEAIPWPTLITDTSYEWWWGDNHLAECVEQAGGRQMRVVGLPVQHVHEGTASVEEWTEQAKWRDRHRWHTRHTRNA